MASILLGVLREARHGTLWASASVTFVFMHQETLDRGVDRFSFRLMRGGQHEGKKGTAPWI